MVGGVLKPVVMYNQETVIREEEILRMLLLGQDMQTDHAVVTRPGKQPNQFPNIEQPMNVRKEIIANALTWESGDAI